MSVGRQLGPRAARRPDHHPARAGLRRRPGQEAARRTDPVDPRSDAAANAGTHWAGPEGGGGGCGPLPTADAIIIIMVPFSSHHTSGASLNLSAKLYIYLYVHVGSLQA